MAVEMPYYSVDNIFKRGLHNTSINTLMKICEFLNISIEALVDDEKITSKGGLQEHSKIINSDTTPPKEKKLPKDEERLLGSYRKLNNDGKGRLLETAEEMTELKKYKILKSDVFVELSQELA